MKVESFINGKPLEEWIKEQQEKDGTLIIHQASQRTTYGISTTKGGISVIGDDRDVAYVDADMEIRINGKLYPLRGESVVRRGGVWYVDGVKQDFPEHTGKDKSTDADNLMRCISDGVKIEIHGDVGRIETKSGDVTVNGEVHRIKTASGDVHCGSVSGDVNTMSGDVHCDSVGGDVSTMSGDIFRR